MGKSGKTKVSASKQEAKAAKKAKLASKAERKENKKVLAADAKKPSTTSGSSKRKKKKANAASGGADGPVKSSKGKGKGGKDGDDVEEDLIQTLEEYRKAWAAEHLVSEEVASVPSRRANATLTACPVSTSNLWLYGGEYFDGQSCFFYPDLFRYNTEKNEWRKLSSPTQPSPRSAHQVVASPAGGGKLWLFGGEFASTNQTSFHHYRDLWAFDIGNKAWERYDTKVKPSARSGHRMALWKNYIVLFGGFHDVGIRTTYLSDLWLWDTTEYRWHEVTIRDSDRRPSARSGFSFLPCPEGLLLHGGYCKEYSGKQVKGVALDDTWLLRMDTDTAKLKWERRKKTGYAPTPRSGMAMAYWQSKGLGVAFGGVTDTYDEDEDLTSVFYNEMFGYQMQGNGRWISLNLKRPKKKGGNAAQQKKKMLRKLQEQKKREEERERKQREKEQEREAEEQRRREAQREEEEWEYGDDDSQSGAEDKEAGVTNGTKQDSAISPAPDPESDSASEEGLGDEQDAQEQDDEPDEEEDDPDDPLKTLPMARYNAMLAIQRNTLYIYGGILEANAKEFCLDDFFSLQLDKLDKFTCHQKCDIAELEWKESDSEDDDEEDGDEDDEDSGSGSDSEGSEDSDDASESGSESEDDGDENGTEVERDGNQDAAQDADGSITPAEPPASNADSVLAGHSKKTKKSKKSKKGDSDPISVDQAQSDEMESAMPVEDAPEEISELRARATAFMGVAKSVERSPEDLLSTPLPGETLKTFYDRTREFWTQKAHEQSDSRGKELRRGGFAMADDRYEEYKPILEEIERIQAEAGLEDEDVAKGGPKASGLGVESRHRR